MNNRRKYELIAKLYVNKTQQNEAPKPGGKEETRLLGKFSAHSYYGQTCGQTTNKHNLYLNGH